MESLYHDNQLHVFGSSPSQHAAECISLISHRNVSSNKKCIKLPFENKQLEFLSGESFPWNSKFYEQMLSIFKPVVSNIWIKFVTIKSCLDDQW